MLCAQSLGGGKWYYDYPAALNELPHFVRQERKVFRKKPPPEAEEAPVEEEPPQDPPEEEPSEEVGTFTAL